MDKSNVWMCVHIDDVDRNEPIHDYSLYFNRKDAEEWICQWMSKDKASFEDVEFIVDSDNLGYRTFLDFNNSIECYAVEKEVQDSFSKL